jgi:NosR/NirI family nitrous oxide reductase transcriptional regulator
MTDERRRGPRVALLLLALILAPAVSHGAQPPDDTPPLPGAETLSLDDLEALEGLEGLDELLAEDEGAGGATPVVDRSLILDLVGLAFVLAFAMFSFFRKSEPLKVVSFALSIGYLGFYKASLVSVVDIFGAMSGTLPGFALALPYYVLIAFTVVSTILWGRVYCGRICAFGALTQMMDRIVPSRYRVELPPWLDRRAVYAKYVILAVAVLYVLGTGNNLVYRYIEPFWMFTLSGNALMWTLLTVLLLATVFVRNLYCRYLCSVGAGLGILSQLTVFGIKRWSECKTCKLCEKTCEWGAIDGPKIIKSECVRCDDCERLYADEDKCPHWLILKRAPQRPTPAAAITK